MGFTVIKPARLQPADLLSAATTSGSMQVPLSLRWQQNGTQVSLILSFTDVCENGTEVIFIYRSSLIYNEVTS